MVYAAYTSAYAFINYLYNIIETIIISLVRPYYTTLA